MRRARRVDANQPAIVDALRRAGCSVEVLSDVGRGVADLLVGVARVNYLIEIKSDGEGLTATEQLWHSRWRGGRPAIVHTVEDALLAVGIIPVLADPKRRPAICGQCGQLPRDCNCAEKQEQKKREELKRAMEAK